MVPFTLRPPTSASFDSNHRTSSTSSELQQDSPVQSTSKLTLTSSLSRKRKSSPSSSSLPAAAAHEVSAHANGKAKQVYRNDLDQAYDGLPQEDESDQEEERLILQQADTIKLFKILQLFQLLDIPLRASSQHDAASSTSAELPVSLRIALSDSTDIALADLRLWCSIALSSSRYSSANVRLLSEAKETLAQVIDAFEREYLKDETRLSKRPKLADAPKQYYTLHRGLNTTDLFTSASTKLTDEDLAILAESTQTDLLTTVPTPAAVSLAPPLLQDIKLRDVNSRTPTYNRREAAYPTPVSLLYYSPFSSFAPSYDSTMATTTYARSCALTVSMREIEELESEEAKYWAAASATSSAFDIADTLSANPAVTADVVPMTKPAIVVRTKEEEVVALMLGEAQSPIDPALVATLLPASSSILVAAKASAAAAASASSARASSTTTSAPMDFTSSEIDFLRKSGFDSSMIDSLLGSLARAGGVAQDDGDVDPIEKELEANRERLAILLRGQWQRLRTSATPRVNTAAVPLGVSVVAPNPDTLDSKVGEKEEALAQEVLQSLTTLLASRPAYISPAAHRSTPLPFSSSISRIASSLVKSLSTSAASSSTSSRWMRAPRSEEILGIGTLEPNDAKSLRESDLASFSVDKKYQMEM